MATMVRLKDCAMNMGCIFCTDAGPPANKRFELFRRGTLLVDVAQGSLKLLPQPLEASKRIQKAPSSWQSP